MSGEYPIIIYFIILEAFNIRMSFYFFHFFKCHVHFIKILMIFTFIATIFIVREPFFDPKFS